MVAKSKFENFATKGIYKLIRVITCLSKNVIYIAFGLNCLKQGVGSTVDWKTKLLNYKSHIKKRCNLKSFLTTLSKFVVTQMIPQKSILDLLSLIS